MTVQFDPEISELRLAYKVAERVIAQADAS